MRGYSLGGTRDADTVTGLLCIVLGAGRGTVGIEVGVDSVYRNEVTSSSCAGMIGVSNYRKDELETVAQGDVRSEYRCAGRGVRRLVYRNKVYLTWRRAR